ncbi:MAG TPA: glycosyltransferase family 4 protein [Candidatus Paceibacterota bacterium]|nr:glycosyltransferase family 4 protein [Candidatus Paceibacterota bacterium]
MTICILSNTKMSTGGVERFCAYLERAFRSLGHTVEIVSTEDLSSYHRSLLRFFEYFGLAVPLLGYFLGNYAKRKKPDVYVTNGALGWNLKDKKIVNVQHGTFAQAAKRLDRKNPLKFFFRFYIWGYFEGVAARRASRVVAVSQETKESVELFYKVKNIAVVYNAVDTNFFAPRDDRVIVRKELGFAVEETIVLFVGRFERAKGKAILEGMEKYLSHHSGRLIVAEQYSQDELAKLYSAADLFLFPSLHEGCSYALLDAMSSGLLFLASPVGLVADFVKENLFSGCIVHEQTLVRYSDAFEKIHHMGVEEKMKLSERLRNYILSKHTLAVFTREYERILSEVIL